jgi:hypothetical protein
MISDTMTAAMADPETSHQQRRSNRRRRETDAFDQRRRAMR